MKKAVILFNMGGPDSLDAVYPFLFNIFYDSRIMWLWNPIRYFVAWWVAYRRKGHAMEIYRQIGGKSPLLENTKAQAEALERKLNEICDNEDQYQVFVCMRYWHPMADEVVKNMTEFGPDSVILLPLHAHYSTSTTLSSIENWLEIVKSYELNYPTKIIGHYNNNKDFIAAHTKLVAQYYDLASKLGKPRILFSAHGLPIRVIESGDPYESQVEETSRLIAENLGISDLDWRVCYQSKVGPLRWLEPSTEDELRRAAKDNVPVVLAPVGFVSEHSETLFELDIEYKPIIKDGYYFRVPTLGIDPLFIKCLADLCMETESQQ